MSAKYRDKLGEINNRISDSDIPIRESYYLNNWYRYKENINVLSKGHLENARTFFKAMKELSDEDRNFLATKYDRPTIQKGQGRVHPSDEHVAEELGMEQKEYRKQRIVVQKRLKAIMQEHSDINRMEKYERIQNINRGETA